SETVQGETTLAERFAPGTPKAYNCNLELVGQFEGEGSAGYMNAFDHCLYFSTWENDKLKRPGVQVIDISDTPHPALTTSLTSPSMLNANEFLGIDPTRKLLFANRLNTTMFEVYDLSADCAHPVLKSSRSVPGMTLHAGEFAPDQKTLYGASCSACTGIE